MRRKKRVTNLKGRPGLISPEGIEEAGKLARAGATHGSIARILRVSAGTFEGWKRRGRAELDRLDSVLERIQVVDAEFRTDVIGKQEHMRKKGKFNKELDTPEYDQIYLDLVLNLGVGSGKFETDMLTYARQGAAKKHPELALKLLALRGGDAYKPATMDGVVIVNNGDGSTNVFSGSCVSDGDFHDAAAMISRRSMERKNALRAKAAEEKAEAEEGQ